MSDTKYSKARGIIADLVRSTASEPVIAYKARILEALVPLMIDVCNEHQSPDNGDFAADMLIDMLAHMDSTLLALANKQVAFEIQTTSTGVATVLLWLTNTKSAHDFEARQFDEGDLWTVTFNGLGHEIGAITKLCKKAGDMTTFSMRIG